MHRRWTLEDIVGYWYMKNIYFTEESLRSQEFSYDDMWSRGRVQDTPFATVTLLLTSATWKGWDMNLWALRARATVSLSSSDNSSMPIKWRDERWREFMMGRYIRLWFGSEGCGVWHRRASHEKHAIGGSKWWKDNHFINYSTHREWQ